MDLWENVMGDLLEQKLEPLMDVLLVDVLLSYVLENWCDFQAEYLLEYHWALTKVHSALVMVLNQPL